MSEEKAEKERKTVEATANNSPNLKNMQAKAQLFGSRLSNMVLPNIGAFMGWGILTVIGVWTGSEVCKGFVSPMLKYLLPLLVGFAGGYEVHKVKGGVIGAFATMGCIIATDITMFIGAMIVAPLAAWLLKEVDVRLSPHFPVGFEILFESLLSAVIGVAVALLGFTVIAPAIASFSLWMAGGVNFLQDNGLLPLAALIIEPAKVLFLNGAISTGILTPLGTIQVGEAGKSILFLLESNPGPGLGILLAYCIFGHGDAKSNAYGATAIHFFGGIHEMYFPFVLMKPSLVFAAMVGGFTADAIFSIFRVGLVSLPAPGSIITISLLAAPGDLLPILLGITASAVVSFLVASPLLRHGKDGDEKSLQVATAEMEELKGSESRATGYLTADVKKKSVEKGINYSTIKKILYVCGNGVGTSAMGASVISKKLKKQGIDDIAVLHARVGELPQEADAIFTNVSLADAVKERADGVPVIVIEDYLNAPEYDDLVRKIADARKAQ